jgi:hypothetical protein
MESVRTDVIALFDIDFGDHLGSPHLERLRAAAAPQTRYADGLAESFSWIFYEEGLPGFERLTFPVPPEGSIAGMSLLLSQEYGVGVFSVWCQFGATDDSQRLKEKAWNDSEEQFTHIAKLLPDGVTTERQFPFVALRVPGREIEAVMQTEAEAIGRLFTGGYDHEARSFLVKHVSENISRRSYECLLLSWTDALGVYGSDVDEQTYEWTFMRALQLFETCIVIRRIFLSLGSDIDRLVRGITLATPRPWKVNGTLQAFKTAERRFLIAPPVQSVEAERLLSEAFLRFGIARVQGSAANGCAVLEQRYQWVKTQFLVLLGVITYFLDKLKVFDALVPWGHR